jgi:SAM-dependent methyltransferase
VTPATHERVNCRPGNEWARDLRDVFGWSRPFHKDLLPPGLFDLMRAADVVAPHGDGWRSLVRLSSLEGQMFLHSAFPTVDADAVFFGPDTYRFAAAIREYFTSALTGSRKVTRAVDIGCGAGPGAIVTALARPEAQVLAVDINDRALSFARVNAALAGTPNVLPQHSNLLTDVDGMFDLIVANPPYLVDPTERAYRHGGGPLGAGLSLAIVEAAPGRLAPGGPCCCTPARRSWTASTRSALPSKSGLPPHRASPGLTARRTRMCSAKNWRVALMRPRTASPRSCSQPRSREPAAAVGLPFTVSSFERWAALHRRPPANASPL